MKTYSTIQGDTYDIVSYRVYGDEGHVGAIIAVNPDYAETVVFSAGVTLTIPDLPVTASASKLPPWRQTTEG